jgi:Domain of unknown function (DUF3291)
VHLALINIARAKYDLSDPLMAGFVDNIARVNAAAERSPGFVWRLVDEDTGNALTIDAFGDPRLIVNMAVWDSLQALRDFTYRTVHNRFVARRAEWFEETPVYMALWWVPEDAVPTLADGKRRLALLRQNGPSLEAFTFGTPFDPPVSAPTRAVDV